MSLTFLMLAYSCQWEKPGKNANGFTVFPKYHIRSRLILKIWRAEKVELINTKNRICSLNWCVFPDPDCPHPSNQKVRICLLRQQQLFFERNEDSFLFPAFKVQVALKNVCRKEYSSSWFTAPRSRKILSLTSNCTSLESGAFPLFILKQHHYLPLYTEPREERPKESTQV